MLEQITDGAAAYHAISFRLVSCLGAAGGTGQSGDTSKQLAKRPVMISLGNKIPYLTRR